MSAVSFAELSPEYSKSILSPHICAAPGRGRCKMAHLVYEPPRGTIMHTNVARHLGKGALFCLFVGAVLAQARAASEVEPHYTFTDSSHPASWNSFATDGCDSTSADQECYSEALNPDPSLIRQNNA